MKLYLFLIVFALTIGTKAYSCICETQHENTKEDFDLEWSQVDYIMEIKVTKLLYGKINGQSPPQYIDQDSLYLELPYMGDVVLEAEVIKIHKGQVKTSTIELFTVESGGSMCQFHYKLGQSYLFYGNKNEKSSYYETSSCSRTGPLNKKEFDLQLLKKKM